jgi:CobQ-like glutamine amidotransferase family enzyme/UDP-N-acetylmuramyl tripeptide synthase
VTRPSGGGPVSVRARLAGRATTIVSAASRRLGLGGGSVIGGRVGLLLDPGLLAALATGRRVALVSGTNGKTTTTRLLATALGGSSRVATSAAGANMPGGLVSALAASEPGLPAALEVDEGYLGSAAAAVAPSVVTLLNLSRDQLDRVSEVRMVAGRWRHALEGISATVVANADDPLVTWGASGAAHVLWVSAGQLWHHDAVGCPACDGRIVFEPGGDWWCTCGFRRPAPDAVLREAVLDVPDGRSLPVRLTLPGRCNRANAAMAAMSASVLGVDVAEALSSMAELAEVEGRFATADVGGRSVRLLLAKNPAGWTELLDLLGDTRHPVVVGINARIADGHDPSWLWDVSFERLSGRLVVATGERCRDLAVRLRYAGVDHVTVPDEIEALATPETDRLDFVGNYTSFQDVRRRLHAGDGDARHVQRGHAMSPDAGVVHATPVPAPASSVVSRAGRAGPSALRVVVVHPDLLGTYGDGGNGAVLAARAAWRDLPVELVHAPSDAPLPEGADIYCLGGGEDGPQIESAERLRRGTLGRAVDHGAVVLAVCAGYQVLGNSFPGPDGALHAGVGLLDVESVKGAGRRAVGELAAVPIAPDAATAGPGGGGDPVALQTLTGFENHGAVTRLGSGVRPLARVLSGVGNGAGHGDEGARAGRVLGTYMHGPALARNPSLADLLLSWATGDALVALDDEEERALHDERLATRPRQGGHRLRRLAGPSDRVAGRTARRTARV